ncbi:hypothetical protein M434DRAFT_37880 [Hypoxylon sp. CO27-5]|nr:hypothetical protein M434DRAFT_37880 [Hypoxylon sp. CO27-5]
MKLLGTIGLLSVLVSSLTADQVGTDFMRITVTERHIHTAYITMVFFETCKLNLRNIPTAPYGNGSTSTSYGLTRTVPLGTVGTSSTYLSRNTTRYTNSTSIPSSSTRSISLTTMGNSSTLLSISTSSSTTSPDSMSSSSKSSIIVIGTNTITVPTSLNTPVTVTTIGQNFTFSQSGQISNNTTQTTHASIQSSSNSTQSNTSQSSSTSTPTSQTTTQASQTPTRNADPTTTSTTSEGGLITYTIWPPNAVIEPVTTSVDKPKPTDNGVVVPCHLWFISGTAAASGSSSTESINHTRNYSPMAKSHCETKTASLCATTESIEPSTTETASSCEKIVGCNVQDSDSTKTNSCTASKVTSFLKSN